MESRELNISFQKSGSGSINTRLSVPKKWVDAMGITRENADVKVEFDGEQITIKKEKRMKPTEIFDTHYNEMTELARKVIETSDGAIDELGEFESVEAFNEYCKENFEE